MLLRPVQASLSQLRDSAKSRKEKVWTGREGINGGEGKPCHRTENKKSGNTLGCIPSLCSCWKNLTSMSTKRNREISLKILILTLVFFTVSGKWIWNTFLNKNNKHWQSNMSDILYFEAFVDSPTLSMSEWQQPVIHYKQVFCVTEIIYFYIFSSKPVGYH